MPATPERTGRDATMKGWSLFEISKRSCGVQFCVDANNARCYLLVKGTNAPARAKRVLRYLRRNKVTADSIGDSK